MDILKFIFDFFRNYLSNNFILIACLICLAFIFMLELYIGKLEKKYLKLCTIVLLITSIIHNLDITVYRDFALIGSPIAFRLVTCYLLHIMLPMLGLAIFKIITVDKFNKIYVVIPAAINVILMASCFFSFGAFRINELGERVINNNVLYYSTYFFSGIYIVLSIIFVFVFHRGGRLEEYLIVTTANAAVLTSAILEIAFNKDALIINVTGVALIIYYVFIIIRCLNRDALTHCLNRFSYFTDLNYYRKKITSIISIDVNDLKVINDLEGHFYGDICLEMVSKAIISSCPKEAPCYRIGGDEFSIICNGLSEDKVKEIISDIRSKVNKSDYSVAIGYCMIKDADDVNNLIVKADSKMYADKARIKEGRDLGST